MKTGSSCVVNLVKYCLILFFFTQKVYTCRQWGFRVKAIFGTDKDDLKSSSNNQNQQTKNQGHAKFFHEDPSENPFFSDFYTMYTDQGGCYEEGDSKNYKGLVHNTNVGLECANWTIFTKWLRHRVNTSMQTLEKYRENLIWGSRENYERVAKLEAEIQATNHTIVEFEQTGLLDHSYCRDPDESGRPWCFIESPKHIIWQTCAVPKCTPCWRIRQRALKYVWIPQSPQYWMPNCDTGGTFKGRQCWRDYCWCSDEKGGIIRGTLTRKSDGVPICKNLKKDGRRLRKKKNQNKKLNLPTATNLVQIHPKNNKQSEVSHKENNETLLKGIRRLLYSKKKQNLLKKLTNAKTKTKRRMTSKRRDIYGPNYFTTYDQNRLMYEGNYFKQTRSIYKCQYRYVNVETLKCENVKSSVKNINGTKMRRCFVVRKRVVKSWLCISKLGKQKCHVMRFNRQSLNSNDKWDVFRGVKYVCLQKGMRHGKRLMMCDPIDKKSWLIVYNTVIEGKTHKCVETWENNKRKMLKCTQIKN